MTLDEKEAAFQAHRANESEDGYHVDGCFYCGGEHPADCCPSSRERDEYWGDWP